MRMTPWLAAVSAVSAAIYQPVRTQASFPMERLVGNLSCESYFAVSANLLFLRVTFVQLDAELRKTAKKANFYK